MSAYTIKEQFWLLVVQWTTHHTFQLSQNIFCYSLPVTWWNLLVCEGLNLTAMTPILWTWQSTSLSLCSDSRLVMPAYYSASIPDWSPSSTINLNWLSNCGWNRARTWPACVSMENRGLAKVAIFVNLTVIRALTTSQMNIIFNIYIIL